MVKQSQIVAEGTDIIIDILRNRDLRLKWVLDLMDDFPYLVALVERHIKEGRKHG